MCGYRRARFTLPLPALTVMGTPPPFIFPSTSFFSMLPLKLVNAGVATLCPDSLRSTPLFDGIVRLILPPELLSFIYLPSSLIDTSILPLLVEASILHARSLK
jgi:hypothetical protein